MEELSNQGEEGKDEDLTQDDTRLGGHLPSAQHLAEWEVGVEPRERVQQGVRVRRRANVDRVVVLHPHGVDRHEQRRDVQAHVHHHRRRLLHVPLRRDSDLVVRLLEREASDLLRGHVEAHLDAFWQRGLAPLLVGQLEFGHGQTLLLRPCLQSGPEAHLHHTILPEAGLEVNVVQAGHVALRLDEVAHHLLGVHRFATEHAGGPVFRNGSQQSGLGLRLPAQPVHAGEREDLHGAPMLADQLLLDLLLRDLHRQVLVQAVELIVAQKVAHPDVTVGLRLPRPNPHALVLDNGHLRQIRLDE